MRQRFSQSYHIFDSSLTRVKGTVKVISIFDLAFDKNQMCDKSNFSCRVIYSFLLLLFFNIQFACWKDSNFTKINIFCLFVSIYR